MPRQALTTAEVEQVREACCEAAFSLYGSDGYAGVTMRGIAREMGVSPMTAYRYFESKDAIFAAICAQQFNHLADRLAAVSDAMPPLVYLRALAEAYATFAHDRPQAYRLLYMTDFGDIADYPEVDAAQGRTRALLFRGTRDAVAAGDLVGDPAVLAHTLWASLHGLVSLDLAGQLTRGATFPALFSALLDTLLGQKSERVRH